MAAGRSWRCRLTLILRHSLQGLLDQFFLIEAEGHKDGPGKLPLSERLPDPSRGHTGVQLKRVEEHLGVQGEDEEPLCAGGRPAAPCGASSKGASSNLESSLIPNLEEGVNKATGFPGLQLPRCTSPLAVPGSQQASQNRADLQP